MTVLSMIVAIGGAVAVIVAFFKTLFKFYKLVEHQAEQDDSIREIKDEQALIIEGIHACLDGLTQLNCNHTVPETKQKLHKHINEKAHK